MPTRRVLQIGSLLWAAVGAVIAWSALGTVNADARWIVAAASVLGPAAAVAAAGSLGRRHDRLAGTLLLVSVLTPTYFAAVVNLPALVVGLVLLVAPRSILPSHEDAVAVGRSA